MKMTFLSKYCVSVTQNRGTTENRTEKTANENCIRVIKVNFIYFLSSIKKYI